MNVRFFVAIGGVEYPVLSVKGKIKDAGWNDRESKYIDLQMSAAEVSDIFKDGIDWSIVECGSKAVVDTNEDGTVKYDENGGLAMVETDNYRKEYDNSDFCVLGDIVIHPDGTCTVAMGKETAEEKLITMMYGGVV
jgi:hypothetical protein